MDEPEPAFINTHGQCEGQTGSSPMVIEGQARISRRDFIDFQPGAAALLAAAHAYHANAKRLVRRLPAGSMRTLNA